MDRPIENGIVVVSLPNGDSSRFVVRISITDQIFVSPENNEDTVSSISFNHQNGKWCVDGTDCDYTIEFEPPAQNLVEYPNLHEYVDVLHEQIMGRADAGNFDEADQVLEIAKKNMIQNLTLASHQDLDLMYKLADDISRNELYKMLDWHLKHGVMYGGYLLSYYLYGTIPLYVLQGQQRYFNDEGQRIRWAENNEAPKHIHPLIREVIRWILDHNIAVTFDPNDRTGRQLRDKLRESVIFAVFNANDGNLFRELNMIPGLFDFIADSHDPDQTMAWILEQIDEHNAENVRMSMQPTVKSSQKR